MCGIVGCILKNRKAAPILFDCISKFEYRGYDSVGMATSNGCRIYIKKDSGKIQEVNDKINFGEMPGDLGIAHVRWATRGSPSKENAHPHTNLDGNIAVVHNGIIENYIEIRSSLESEGFVFRSQSDTEVVPILIAKFMDEGSDLEKSLRKTARVIKGSYVICVISKKNPGKIVAIVKDNPLAIGICDGGYFITSDISTILNYTNNIIYIDNGELVVLNKSGAFVKDSDGNIVDKEIDLINWNIDTAQKEGYDYFMLKEIHEQDQTVRDTLSEKDMIKEIILKLDEINRVCFIACGTSYHASLMGKYLFESMLGIPTDVILASEFKYFANALDEKTLTIFITQSGETADSLKSLRRANKVSKTLVITNVLGSSATHEADFVIYTRAGDEISIAATKTYISQLVCIYLFAGILSGNDEILNRLEKVPDYILAVMNREDEIKAIASKYKNAQDFFFIGRGFAYPTALEGALKLKEVACIHGEGYAAGELKHGPLSLIDKEFPVVVIIPPGDSYDKTIVNLEEIRARGAQIIAFGSCEDRIVGKHVEDFFGIDNEVDEIIAPLVYVVPLQLLSYYISIKRGLDPDRPRNLTKCVTVE